MKKPIFETIRKVVFAVIGVALIVYGAKGFADHSITVIGRDLSLVKLSGQKAVVASGALMLCGLLCFLGLVRSILKFILLLVVVVGIGAYIWVHYSKNY